MTDSLGPQRPTMHIVVRDHRFPFATVECLEVGAEHAFPYQVWWRPLSNHLAPMLCAVRRDRDLALGDLQWVVAGLTTSRGESR